MIRVFLKTLLLIAKRNWSHPSKMSWKKIRRLRILKLLDLKTLYFEKFLSFEILVEIIMSKRSSIDSYYFCHGTTYKRIQKDFWKSINRREKIKSIINDILINALIIFEDNTINSLNLLDQLKISRAIHDFSLNTWQSISILNLMKWNQYFEKRTFWNAPKILKTWTKSQQTKISTFWEVDAKFLISQFERLKN